MNRIIIYPDFIGVDVKERKDFNYPVKNITLDNLLRNEIFKDDKHFSSEKMGKYLKSMSEKLDDLPPILIVKNPLEKDKYNILDGHHRFQLFKELNKKTIPAQVIDYKDIFLAKQKYGTKDNTAIRLDKVNSKEMDLERYFNTSNNQEIDEKWSEKYKNSIDCNNPKGFSQRAHCQGKKKNMKETEIVKGGLADNKSIEDIAKKHKMDVDLLKVQLEKGIKVEFEHTKNEDEATEIAKDHLWENPDYYIQLKKVETKETDTSSSGAYSGPLFGKTNVIKRPINKIPNANLNEETEVGEATTSSSVGTYDVPLFGKTAKGGRRDPLKIDGKSSEYKGRAVKDKNFPKWGGPDSVFVRVKEKCKKFPYCNQGNTGAIEFIKEDQELQEAIQYVSKKYGISHDRVEEIVLNEIKQIFI